MMRFLLTAACLLYPLVATGADDERDWAFRRVERPAIPRVQHATRVATPVDSFVLHGLESLGIEPAPRASRRVLARRLHIDLTGLPPTPAAMSRFLSDTRPGAWGRLVDRLLASPAYGHRWAQHWLDVVRYADSDGFEYDDPRPHAWRYRDWVIDSLNHDKPFGRFVAEQIAADELFPEDAAALPALGLHRLGPLRMNAGNQDVAKNRQERLTEMVDVVGSAFLGVTLGCARCHDHKFDPLPQADYYRLQAFFAASQPVDLPLVPAEERTRREQARKRWMTNRDALRKELEAIEDPVRDRLMRQRKDALAAETRSALATEPSQRTPEQSRRVAMAERLLTISATDIREAVGEADRERHEKLHAELARLQQTEPPPVASVMAILERGQQVPVTHRLVRGDPHQLAEIVRPRFPAVMVGPGQDVQPTSFQARSRPAIDKVGARHAVTSTGRRAELAEWLGSEINPLSARVFVNRIWQHHFGEGIVATPNDFGVMGRAASYPELLDWLAAELMAASRRGAGAKHVHRLIVMSSTYQQSSTHQDPRAEQADPGNQLLWRAQRRRLEAEALRDSLLFVSGQLNRQAGGPGVRLPLPPEIAALQYKGNWQPNTNRYQHNRRTVFLFVKRNNRPPLLTNFDAPGTMASCGRRNESSHAGQALALLNSPELDRHARALAMRLQGEVGSAPVALVQQAYRLALGREPTPGELSLGRGFLEEGDSPFDERLADYCLVLFNLDEFLYVE